MVWAPKASDGGSAPIDLRLFCPKPDRLMSCGLPVESLAIRMESDSTAARLAVKVAASWQVAPGARGLVQLLVEMLKSVGLVSVIPVNVTVAVPVLRTVVVEETADDPIFAGPAVSAMGTKARVLAEAMPVPKSPTICGLPTPV